MRTRINKRDFNLAKVSDDKAAEDAFNTQGYFSLYSFFDSALRKQHKVNIGSDSRWINDQDSKVVPNKTFMYAVGSNGALYIGTPTVHSQFKAGKNTQSAGWLRYNWSDETKAVTVEIDNCSGHYTPTLSQFLSTLYGLHATKMLPDNFTIRLSKFTKFDYQDMETDFWENARINSTDKEKSEIIKVEYSARNDTFNFSVANGQTYTMTKEQIQNNDVPVVESSPT